MIKMSVMRLMEIILLSALSASAFPANDSFTNSVQFSDTNITYLGNFTGATLEPGEAQPNRTNTVWMSWAAPAAGYVQVSMASAPQFQYWAVFTGPTVDHLEPTTVVPMYMNNLYRFVASEGTVYHFQFSGGADNFTFYLQFQLFGTCSNDNFTNAQLVAGNNVSFDPATVIGATMELGEPVHMGSVPQKSIWWKWQAPQWGSCYLDPRASLATNYVVVVYAGNSVETLTLVKKATNTYFTFPVNGGQTYAIAAAVPTNSTGDILNSLQLSSIDSSTHTVAGNLLQEPSWEGTAILNAHYWGMSGGVGGAVNEPSGCDGTTWPTLGGGAQIWQDFSMVTGHTYSIRFAIRAKSTYVGGGSGNGQVRVLWNSQEIGVGVLPSNELTFWHWIDFTAIATNATSRVTFVNLGRNVELDAFSVVDASAPPAIVTQPASVSSIVGGTAAFVVGVTGTAPLDYKWFFKDSSLDGQTNKLLVLTSLTTNQVGDYFVIVTNGFGAVTSAVASLLVDAPVNATILSQPYGDTVSVGSYFNFSVVAAGTPPLTYQWFLGDQTISGATNRNLMLTNVQSGDAGVYAVRVQNPSSTVWSLPVTLTVTTSNIGGGTIDFRNRFISGVTNTSAPVFDLDGITLLNGSNYVAQLYAGPTLALLRPVGQPTPFQTGFNAGYFVPQIITLANVAPGSNAVVQVRAWDATFGTSYEEARPMGGRFGKSQILQVVAGGSPLPPGKLLGLQSFSLQAGLPYLQVASIEFVERQEPNTMIWALHGQGGNLYVIEKSELSGQIFWRPHTVVTNVTGTVTFSDTADSSSNVVLYRARILD